MNLFKIFKGEDNIECINGLCNEGYKVKYKVIQYVPVIIFKDTSYIHWHYVIQPMYKNSEKIELRCDPDSFTGEYDKPFSKLQEQVLDLVNKGYTLGKPEIKVDSEGTYPFYMYVLEK